LQVPIPKTPANVPGPVPGNTMTSAYVQLVGHGGSGRAHFLHEVAAFRQLAFVVGRQEEILPRTLNIRTAFFFAYTFITPAMITRLTDIGSQYLVSFVDSKGEYFDGARHPSALPASRQSGLSHALRGGEP
jgi:hypothetical protein